MRILTLDPGNSTGYIIYDTETKQMTGGTIVENFDDIYYLIYSMKLDVVVYETFNMYPGAAKHLVWNDFYPCQVIGVIQLACMHAGITPVKQAPSVKRFSGGLDERWKQFIKKNPDKTEHTKDAYLHLKYYENNHK